MHVHTHKHLHINTYPRIRRDDELRFNHDVRDSFKWTLTSASRRRNVARFHMSIPQKIQYRVINRNLRGRLPSRSELWEAEAENALFIDSLVTATVLHSPFISASLISSLLLPSQAYCSHNLYLWSFLLPSTLLFSLMHNLCSFLSSLYFPWRQSLSLPLYLSPAPSLTPSLSTAQSE